MLVSLVWATLDSKLSRSSHATDAGDGGNIVSLPPTLRVPPGTLTWARVTPSPAVEASLTFGLWSRAQAGTLSNHIVLFSYSRVSSINAVASWFEL